MTRFDKTREELTLRYMNREYLTEDEFVYGVKGFDPDTMTESQRLGYKVMYRIYMKQIGYEPEERDQ